MEEYHVVFETNDGLQTAWTGVSLASAIYQWQMLMQHEKPDYYGSVRTFEIIHVLDTSNFG